MVRGNLSEAAATTASRRRKIRFVAPAREDVTPHTFDHPVFHDFAEHRDLLSAPAWPDLEALNCRALASSPVFVAQTPTLLGDGLHYEARISEQSRIATRTHNWHDLLNALVWLRYPSIKRALNARQVADIARVGGRERTRAQCALTLFDEGGVIVITRNLAMLDAWDTHDWPRLFGTDEWWQGARLLVFGHALLEHALDPEHLLVAKALVIATDDDPHATKTAVDAIAVLAEAIRAGSVLLDPKELRAFPASGMFGWHRSSRDADERRRFLHEGPCFRPLAPGRHYPDPLRLRSGLAQPVMRSCLASSPSARLHG